MLHTKTAGLLYKHTNFTYLTALFSGYCETIQIVNNENACCEYVLLQDKPDYSATLRLNTLKITLCRKLLLVILLIITNFRV